MVMLCMYWLKDVSSLTDFPPLHCHRDIAFLRFSATGFSGARREGI